MMPDTNDFFSPEHLDEHLELSLLLRDSGDIYQDASQADPHLLLVHDLRYLYGAEGTEHVRSLQRVWERLAEEHMRRQNSPARFSGSRHLYMVRPHEETSVPIRPVQPKRKPTPGSGLTALAAVLFLVLMVGSILAIVHFMRAQSAGTHPVAVGTPTAPSARVSPSTSIQGYPYPAPGATISISPASPGSFSALAWSQDSKRIAASVQGKIEIWDAGSSRQPLVFDPGVGATPVALAWSPGAPLLAVGSRLVQVISPSNGEVQFTYPALAGYATSQNATQPLVSAVAWSPNGKLLAVATHDSTSGNTVRVWNVETGKLTYTFTGQRSGEAITSLSWSSDGRYIASANNQSVQGWDSTSGIIIFERFISTSTSVAWSPGALDSSLLAFVNASTTEVWNVWDRKMVSSYPHTTNGVLCWAPRGKYLASASGSAVVIWDVNSGARLYTYTGNQHAVRALAWSQDGNYLASGEGSTSGANVVRIWMA
ncbi:MAG TPA: hypothetical protein VFV38_29810 [Ktedonobacteraceae bacterium]|nr:hypothetical protein [Ktedonobacteraceae bacterium]